MKAVTAAARAEPNSDFNPRLRTTIQKAKELSVPLDNIERAIKKASEPGAAIEELIMEAYAPGGSALLIEALTDSKNRTIAEIKKTLSDHGAKWAEPGSVRWAFSAQGGSAPDGEKWASKFPQELGEDDGEKLSALIDALEEREDVQEVYTNAR